MNKSYVYETCCVNANGDDISEMVDLSREITWKTLIKHVSVGEIETVLPNENPKLSKDWSVRFYKSKYKGQPCYYIDHSAIEYIFIKK